MSIIDEYIEECINLIEHDIISNRGEGKIYCNTNENLTKILKPEYIKDKNVLSVLASSDQALTSYYYNAKSVDVFDSNILAYYYFFLKKWCLLATKNYYISAYNGDLLDYIEYYNENIPEEKEAHYFWKNILTNIKTSLYYSNLFYKYAPYEVPYKNDCEKLSSIMIDKVPNYYRFNIFEPVIMENKYDTIILSNILEYLYEEDDEYIKKKSNILADNLCRMTNPGSVIISSNILDVDYSGNDILEKYFEYEDGTSGYNVRFYNDVPLYYTYTKK